MSGVSDKWVFKKWSPYLKSNLAFNLRKGTDIDFFIRRMSRFNNCKTEKISLIRQLENLPTMQM